MKKCLPVLICLGALASACSKKSKVTPVTPPPVVDPVKQDSTPPAPPSPRIDTFLGSYIDTIFSDDGALISLSDSGNIMFTVRYTDDNMVIFKSLQELPAGGQNSAPWIYYYAFSDTFVKSPTNAYFTANNHFYTISGSNLALLWTYDHYSYFQVSRCMYTGLKQ